MPATQLADQFAQHFPLPLESKQSLLETVNINERIELILSAIQKKKTLADIETDINERVKGRIEENQREYYLREKMRAIREEAGDVADVSEDSDEFRQMIKTTLIPEKH